MLPPVSSASNSYLTYPEARASSESASAKPIAGANTVAKVPGALEQNNEIAARLNLLLLAGHERMPQNLTVLVDLLGSALKMERLPDETLSNYATRLVVALEDLSPRERVTLQRQLMQAFAGLQLRTLMEAFRNPAGPEAATLSFYLELYRQKDRDLAARSVVTSYRQNAGESRAPTAATSNFTGNDAVVVPRVSPAASGHDANTPAASPMNVDRRPAGTSAGTSAEARPAAQGGTTNQPADEGVGFSRQASIRPAISAAEDIQSIRNQVRNLEIVPHTLQAQLDEAFSEGVQASAAPQSQIADLPEQAEGGLAWPDADGSSESDIRSPPPSRQASIEPRAGLSGAIENDPIGPNVDIARSSLMAGAIGQASAMLVTGPAALLVDAVEADLARVLLNLQVGEPTSEGLATDIVPIQSEVEDQVLARRDHSLTHAAPQSDAESLALMQRVRSGGFEEQVAFAMTATQGERPAALQALVLREAIPVPFVNYLIADEFEPDLAEAEERQNADDHAEGGEEQADEDLPDDGSVSGEPNEQVEEQGQEQPLERALEDHVMEEAPFLNLQETTPVSILEDLSSDRVFAEPAGQEDPAHDLYLRMSGLI